MINKKMIVATLATGLVGSGVFNTVSTFAAEQTKDVPVSYNSMTAIPDPENPNSPDYVINVPASITFTDENKDIDATVTMTEVSGAKYQGTKSADVSVASQNGYKLKNGGNKEIRYELRYKNNLMTGTNTSQLLSTMSKDSDKAMGSAKMIGSATATGNYVDTLVYTVASK
ncbi:hypothetical protein [Enterococcus faecalis]|uniref:hypothetical protein n=1 Tax=Enterococcus faecalis TaxID=1351 RepID=UPI0008791E50|nr:hypothetical protein [Enterococcus faecalis]EGO2801447.1 hypothetical protein [Enterococcus faecalis]EGO2834842.1 hypothetical protein [Enterococcus faecalis]EGQ7428279.1 hypothetical protein [Enterococcus faecalis]EJB2753261.1 hypothetical protein [Enterococcus faecalis]EKZ0433959.1 hypothetical protein [Enterococcus faecalis]